LYYKDKIVYKYFIHNDFVLLVNKKKQETKRFFKRNNYLHI